MFICKSISGAHDDMTYFTFYKQSPERNVLQCIVMYCNVFQCIATEVKALPPVEKSGSRTLTRDHPTVAEKPDHQSSDTGFLQKPTRL